MRISTSVALASAWASAGAAGSAASRSRAARAAARSPRTGNGGGPVREPAQRHHRLLGRGRDGRREHRPRARRVSPPEQQLGAKAARRRGRGRAGEKADHLLVLVLGGVGELRDRVGRLRRVRGHERAPLGRRTLPIAGALRQVGELERQRGGPAQGPPTALQHGAGVVELALILERYRPLAPRRLVARRAGDPALGGGPHAVGLVEPRVHAELERAQQQVGRVGYLCAPHQRQQLGEAAQARKHALQAEQRGEVRGLGAQRRQIDGRGIGETALPLQLEPLADRLGGERHATAQRQREERATDAGTEPAHSGGGSIRGRGGAAPGSSRSSLPTWDT